MDRATVQERFGILGTAHGIQQAIDRVRQVARTNITVLLQGESGVGKELFAEAIHGLSSRRHRNLIVVNCGAIPEGLIESELFGAEKGAYTGAVERRTGYFEQADGSTIFLDEIGEMPAAAQVRLLRVLENGTFSRVGSSKLQQTDVRVIAATNKDLGREVAAGRFREDLYYRLSTVILNIPPLRERREDVVPLFESFLYRYAQQYSTPTKRLTPEARLLLENYRWPGNVRELRNVAEQSVVLVLGETIPAEQLRHYLRGVSANGVDRRLVPVSKDPRDADDERERELIYRALLELRIELRELKEQVGALVAASGVRLRPEPLRRDVPVRRDMPVARDIRAEEDANSRFLLVRAEEDEPAYQPIIEDVPYELAPDMPLALPAATGTPSTPPENEDDAPLPTLEDAERELIARALKRFDGNRRQTARALGISERTLYRKIKESDEVL